LSPLFTLASSLEKKIIKFFLIKLQSQKSLHSSPQLQSKLLCYLCTVKLPRLFKIIEQKPLFRKEQKAMFLKTVGLHFAELIKKKKKNTNFFHST